MPRADAIGVFVLVMLLAAPAASQEAIAAADVAIRVAALENNNPDDDGAARTSLVKMGPGAVPHLAPIVLDAERDLATRTALVWVLGEIDSPDVQPTLTRAWKLVDMPGTFRIQVAIALAGRGTFKPLRSFLAPRQADKVLVAKAAIAAANFKDKESLTLIRAHLDHPEIGPFMAIAACRLGDKTAAGQVRPLLKDPVFRDYAAVALAMTGDRTVLIPLRFAMENPDPFIRAEAVSALARMDDRGSLEEIAGLAKGDPDPRVRKAAKRALMRMGRGRLRR